MALRVMSMVLSHGRSGAATAAGVVSRTILLLSWLLPTALPGRGVCAAAGEPGPLRAVYFYTAGCRMCGEAGEAVKAAEKKYAGRLAVEWVELSDPATGAASAVRMFAMLDAHGVKETPELAFFVGETCLAGGGEIAERAGAAVEAELASGTARERPAAVSVDRMGLWTVSLAALADGFNPCAFATVVLLVSMMATAGRSRREVLTIGSAFVLGVYGTYFLIGLALYGVLSRLTGFMVASDLVYYAAFGLCVIFAGLSLFDAWRAGSGAGPKAMVLKLPERLRTRMQLVLGRGVRARGALFTTVLLSAAGVSLLESVCTGQVYFPVIAGLVRDTATRGRGLWLLTWYNLVFVLPLAAVLLLAAWGASAERLARFSRGNVRWAKLGLAAVFIAMAAWMWRGLVWPPGARAGAAAAGAAAESPRLG